ncbi:MAG TPA: DNA/RNA helicase domain-containing protein [Burkholderiales bacterium]|nr:DNA/RNA helicase domain-containing protein [Burkholderiales bacterium]HEX2648935.1 DNA/RNA helicase domain-containing protein [Burkholderiales bacterium]
MRLYAGMSAEFIEDAVQNRIASKLRDAFLAHYRYAPSPGEENAWRNSLRAMSQVFERGHLVDHGIVLEYQLPLTSRRLDCLVAGRDDEGRDGAVIVELKQWSECEATDEESIVRTVVGGGRRDVLHPSAQARQYRDYLADTHTAFYEAPNPVLLSACAYLHNYQTVDHDPLLLPQYAQVLEEVPVFAADDVDPLVHYLRQRLDGGHGGTVLPRIEQSRYRPAKKLLDHVAEVIKAQPSFVLLDEQKIVFDRILGTVTKARQERVKHVFLVSGGPGTGKSVLAIQLMAELSRRGLNAQYATGSRAFTKTLHKIVGPRAAEQFRYFHSYGEAEPAAVDVLICDEAHRLRPSSTNRFMSSAKRATRSRRTQIQEIVDAAKVPVFFIDDKQVVRPGEVGSSRLVQETVAANKCRLYEYTLEAQFRCAGSDAFVNWVDNTLGVRDTANILWNQREEAFEFRIFPSPLALETAIRKRAADGHSARLTAGFCWPWSKSLLPGGRLVNDVVIGDYQRPWNARSEATGLAPGIPREVHWAHDPRGIDQVGCIYTAQGFEFDYVGVIWGPDLSYDPQRGVWKGDRTKSKDRVVRGSGDQFLDLVRNTYRVLLSRGLKGCYVHFMDPVTETFVRSRTEGLETGSTSVESLAPRRPAAVTSQTPRLPPTLRVLPMEKVRPYVNAVPLLELKLAAGYFSGEQNAEGQDHKWVALPGSFRISKDLFVAQVLGESMNRRIPNGAWCLFRAYRAGSRDRQIVVAEHREISDVDTGTHLTVKRYRSEKLLSGGDESGAEEWRHTRITLYPESSDPRYKPIELSPKKAKDLKIVATFEAVID